MFQAFDATEQVTFSLDPFLSKAGNDASDIPFGILQCRTNCHMRLNDRDLTLKKGDIALISSTVPITLSVLPTDRQDRPAFVDAHLFLLPITMNSGMGPNSLIDSLVQNRNNAHIVFRRINHDLTNGYCDQLERLATTTPRDNLLDYQQSVLAGLLLTELSRSDLDAMMIIESDFPENDLRRTPAARQEALILNYIMANISHVSMTAAAAHFGYDTNYFSRLARRLFGKTFSEQVRFIRMNQAKKLLELSSQSINGIAAGLGYRNVATFDHNFKAFTGLTPSEYRESAAREQ